MKIEVYTKENCPFCVNAKKFLSEKSLPYTEYKLNVDFTPESLKSRLGVDPTTRITMPQIFIDDVSIGGYTDMVDKPELFV